MDSELDVFKDSVHKKLDETVQENVSKASGWKLPFFILICGIGAAISVGYKKYQELESAHNAPQMPTGYPGMMVLSMVFPLWFWIMNPRVAQFNS